ncbi:Tumor necrosis factor receptor superfamily member 16 [Halotydeus destructor]|nr:Tumor necrosis factor receptor superfamily member 16 [Halotydeus destructor]
MLLLIVISLANLMASGVLGAPRCPEDPLACVADLMAKVEEAVKSNVQSSEPLVNSVPLVSPPLAEGDATVGPVTTEVSPPLVNETTYCADQPTPANVTTNTTQNGVRASCKKCTICPRKALVVRPCNSTHDTVCSCDQGDFFSALTYECKPCLPCPSGWGVWRHCARNQNTVCRKCPAASYSGTVSGSVGCLPCTLCGEDQVMLQECSRIQDTVCIDKSIGERNFLGLNSKSNAANKVSQLNHHHSETSIILYFCFAGLILLIFSLITYVLIIQCHHKRVKLSPATLVAPPSHVFVRRSPMVKTQQFIVSPLTNYMPLAPSSGHLHRQYSGHRHKSKLYPSSLKSKQFNHESKLRKEGGREERDKKKRDVAQVT